MRGQAISREVILQGLIDLWAVRRRTATKEGAQFLAALIAKRTACLRRLGGDRAGNVAYGRFLHNAAVTRAGLRTRVNGIYE